MEHPTSADAARKATARGWSSCFTTGTGPLEPMVLPQQRMASTGQWSATEAVSPQIHPSLCCLSEKPCERGDLRTEPPPYKQDVAGSNPASRIVGPQDLPVPGSALEPFLSRGSGSAATSRWRHPRGRPGGALSGQQWGLDGPGIDGCLRAPITGTAAEAPIQTQ